MSLRTILSVLCALLLLTGCGSGSAIPPFPRDHPANPEAGSGPAVSLPPTLDVGEPVQRPSPLEEPEHEEHEDHAGPGGPEQTMPSPQQEHGGH
jgi:hypothetical protein